VRLAAPPRPCYPLVPPPSCARGGVAAGPAGITSLAGAGAVALEVGGVVAWVGASRAWLLLSLRARGGRDGRAGAGECYHAPLSRPAPTWPGAFSSAAACPTTLRPSSALGVRLGWRWLVWGRRRH